ncbi:MAG: diguanylate cyclase [Dokdonella sp.]
MAQSVVATAAGRNFARAQLAASSQRLAASTGEALGGSTSMGLARAIGGAPGCQALLTLLGDFSAALDVPALSDRQWDQALAIAQQRGDRQSQIALTAAVAESALSLGDYERSQALAANLRGLAQEVGDAGAQAQAENITGVIERRHAHLDVAIKHQQRAIELFRADHNTIGAMRALSDLGTALRDRGDFAQALEAQLEATAERERSGDRLENVYRNLALLYREIEDTAASREYFQHAIDEATRRGVPSVYSSVVGSYSSLLNDVDDYDGARNVAEEALAIDEALGDRPHQGFEHLELGRALLGLKKPAEAVEHLQRALQLGRELQQRELIARALLHLTEAALAERDHLRARGMIDEAIAGLEAAHLRPQLAQAYSLREQLARSEQDDTEALRFAHKSADAREELIGIRASRQLAALEVRHARSDSEQRLALLAKDNDLQNARLDQQAAQRRFGAIALGGLLLALLAVVWRSRGVRRLNRALELRHVEIERQRAALGEANTCLEKQAADLYHSATTDWLTGVSNRRVLLERLEQRVHEHRAQKRELALLLIDFDNFKLINDRLGHLLGDRALISGAQAMRECLGDNDLLGRFGGEEFIAVIGDCDPSDVLETAEHMRGHVASLLSWLASDLRATATISIGLAFLSDVGAPAGASALVDAADRALYQAKNAGRNRVQRYAA